MPFTTSHQYTVIQLGPSSVKIIPSFLFLPSAAALILKKEEDVKGRPFLSKSLEKIYILLFEDKR